MPLFRSGSAKSTLSVMQRRTTKYQKFLNVSNVFLLITSTILIFSAAVLIKFYHLSKLGFWSDYFWVAPYLMIVLGVYTFLVTVFGFLISGTENRALLVIYAALLAAAFLVQLISIFTCLELRNQIELSGTYTHAMNEELAQYGDDDSITAKWDDLQRNMHCCGGFGHNVGWINYKNVNNNFTKFTKGVPDSCCLQYSEGCGRGILGIGNDQQVAQNIYTHGCVTLLEINLREDVLPWMIAYAIIGVVLAIAEIITVVMAAAYVAQIRRKLHREERMWRHTADAGADGTDAPLNHDTMV